jgi:hypothetical protein
MQHPVHDFGARYFKRFAVQHPEWYLLRHVLHDPPLPILLLAKILGGNGLRVI